MGEPLDPAWIVQAGSDLLVVEKPAGLLSQPGLGPELADSLITRAQRHWPQARLVHRLDRDTSGLIVLALCPELHRLLSIAFAERRVEKHYVADVLGRPAAPGGCIELPIAKCQHRPPRYGVDHGRGKPCRTHWRLWAEAPPPGPGEQPTVSRLELRPHTGRSHQLRVHLQAIGHPILGDPLYGSPESVPRAGRRLHLHATALRFQHPRSGEALAFSSAVPFQLPTHALP